MNTLQVNNMQPDAKHLPLTLFLGGTRSGKSGLAEKYAAWILASMEEYGVHHTHVLYVATAEASDVSMQRRIDAHQKRRPDTWQSLEIPYNLAQNLEQYLDIGIQTQRPTVILIDCVTLWISNILFSLGDDVDAQTFENVCLLEVERLISLIDKYQSIQWLMVSGETGLGGIGTNSLERMFQDCLGLTNQKIADVAKESFLCVAGRAIPLGIEMPWY
ncbi:MAG: bifunctional adenosylcobinamide kinase/adenosylcobinamide-phosphate guanylyltransferase [Pseudomonadota bacterium]